MATATCSALLAAALLCNAPAVTLHGAPISGTVEVYRLAPPAVTPAVTPAVEQEPSPERSGARGLIRRGALVGGVLGCPIGNYLSRRYNDDAHLINCLWVGGVGAAIGALVGSLY